MGDVISWGGFCFGLVIGYVTYRTVRRAKQSGLSDIATVIGAVGGATVTGLFPKESLAFGMYGIGLAAGFFLYLIVALVLAGVNKNLSAVNEWLGDPQTGPGPGQGAGPLPPTHA